MVSPLQVGGPTQPLGLGVGGKRGLKTRITYSTASPEIVNKPLAIYVIPYEQYSTLNTDNIASCAGFMRMYYKDF